MSRASFARRKRGCRGISAKVILHRQHERTGSSRSNVTSSSELRVLRMVICDARKPSRGTVSTRVKVSTIGDDSAQVLGVSAQLSREKHSPKRRRESEEKEIVIIIVKLPRAPRFLSSRIHGCCSFALRRTTNATTTTKLQFSRREGDLDAGYRRYFCNFHEMLSRTRFSCSRDLTSFSLLMEKSSYTSITRLQLRKDLIS